ncbi:LOW QUALITY PROTEIN: probable protein phosphatase 2C 4 [Phalaenopsis equestris]|uniref:LOW QUALITY PROTEIN: probable protein phosphatase 2C 4 n=1 Tax=Phalaenopsis equestris TaxID=78828 RepID=UPI0009E4ED46|nr:LOW QUALITY PROTEIN: probable protein phosphatase 2C 4 [Phalaenopsis equestris]
MGNGIAKIKSCCFTGCGVSGDLRESAAVTSEPYDGGLGHTFSYVRPESSIFWSGPSKVHHSEETTTFGSISGAAVSANPATPLSTDIDAGAGAAFKSSASFSSVPLQPAPRFSGSLSGPLADRGFLSGPIERAGFMSGPAFGRRGGTLRRSLSHGLALRSRAAASLLRSVTTVISRSISAPLRESVSSGSSSTLQLSSFAGGASERYQWAQGRAGEDRVHVVISEEHGWLFVGIYDGFNGPDATDYLLSNLYSAVQQEVKGLLWVEDKNETFEISSDNQIAGDSKNDSFPNEMKGLVSPEENTVEGYQKRRSWNPARKSEDNQKRWKYQWFRERLELDRSVRNQLSRSSSRGADTHAKVLKALSVALKKTEEAFLEVADMIVSENPELALMGSCVLVMVMKGEDVYLMNVGDSRAVLGKKAEPDIWDSMRNERLNLESINEETLHDLENYDCSDDQMNGLQSLVSLQLTKDHSTSVEEEVKRIRNEHPEDSSAIVNDRVKGSLKVTRAFGAGFLKQPKWNNAILEMFRIDYIGTSPYITCNPFLSHHRLSSKDKFLILSSDGLYQYFTNEEAVAEVELFISTNPEGDPAQHLVEEVLFRAAKNAGMDFYELLEIPLGDRRRYHDDVSIIIISFEGRIWRSCHVNRGNVEDIEFTVLPKNNYCF